MYIVTITFTILFPQYCFLVLTKAAGNITAEANEANRVEAIKFYSVSKVMNYTIGRVGYTNSHLDYGRAQRLQHCENATAQLLLQSSLPSQEKEIVSGTEISTT